MLYFNQLLERVLHMLKRFEVENFKGFSDRLVFDLSAREYSFNEHIVKDHIVNKAIVYGKNGIGKSSLGIALFDIVRHLTDKEKMKPIYLMNYLNLDNVCNYASFKYVFQFGSDELIYEYTKSDPDNLLTEKLTINCKLVIDYDYSDLNSGFVDESLKGGELNIDLIDNKLSVLKYIYRNRPDNPSSPFSKMMNFINNMLWYRCLTEGNAFCGFMNGDSVLVEGLYQSGKLKLFEEFLKSNGVDYNLKFRNINGQHLLMAEFGKGDEIRETPFESLASTGTMALFLFYFWSISSFNRVSFVFIDEFDAFLHYESAENIVKLLNNCTNFQTILTTHNTYLMNNELTRPDCCFLMTKNKIRNLYDSTDKEIREAHNLEKMYINGVFNE